MARLASYVHVADDRGVAHVFGPDDDVPGWAQKAITNPKAWAEVPAPEGSDGPPPKAGAGSSKEAWVAYAARVDVALDGDPTRDEVIAAVEQAGKPVD